MHFCCFSMLCAHPMNSTLYGKPAGISTTFTFRQVGAMHLGNITIGIFNTAHAFYNVRTLQAHFITRGKAEEFFRGFT